MKKPYVIAINAVSGGGKTALARLVQESLPASMLFCFDDFDDTNIYPDDFYEWSRQGRNPLQIDCPGMGEAVARVYHQAKLKNIVLDYPLGRDHPRFASIINLSVFIDTPLDVAMARRILRDYAFAPPTSAAEKLKQLGTEMTHYLEKARYPYLDACKHKETADLILDGWRPLAELCDQVLAKTKANNATFVQ
ncbi:MAG: hypothetical protein R2911_17265 [Caldilineaceae bacterium]